MKPELNPRITRLMLSPRDLGLLVAVCGLLIGLELLGETGRELLRYERSAIEAGELWRLLTGHLVHLGWSHLALNLAGLVLMTLLFSRDYTPWRGLIVMLASMAVIDLGFYFFEPQLEWYVGFSGVLHGILAAGTAEHWRRRHPDAWILGVFLVIKLAWEQWAGPMPSSAAIAGGPVVVQAHLYGALGGALAALGLRYW